jgi:Zn-finger nucleic acid-binding protein
MIIACGACNERFEAGSYRDQTCPKCGAIALATRACPHCTSPLGATKVEDHAFDECGRCGGVFIDQATIARVVADHADELLAQLRAVTDVEAVTAERKCPTCAVTMTKRMASGGSGAILDVCNSHGVFFDAGEVHTLIKFARQEAERSEREQRLQYQEASESSEDVTAFHVAAMGGLIALDIIGGPVGLVGKLLLIAIGAAVKDSSPTDSSATSRAAVTPHQTQSLGASLEAAQRRRRRDGI